MKLSSTGETMTLKFAIAGAGYIADYHARAIQTDADTQKDWSICKLLMRPIKVPKQEQL